MKKITSSVKAIADAHISARIEGNKFDKIQVANVGELHQQLLKGKVIEAVLDEIEIRYCPITSIFLSRQLLYTSKAYRSGVYKGFKVLFGN